jgi:flagellar basal body-associated protein FliL
MFEFWNKLSPLKKILIIIAIILVVVVIAVFVIIHFKKPKETYTTALNRLMSTDEKMKAGSSDPLKSYVDGWINSVRDLYSTKSVNEPYVEARTMKNFNMYTYLDKNPLITGVNKY